jgi:hypothetical protein
LPPASRRRGKAAAIHRTNPARLRSKSETSDG